MKPHLPFFPHVLPCGLASLKQKVFLLIYCCLAARWHSNSVGTAGTAGNEIPKVLKWVRGTQDTRIVSWELSSHPDPPFPTYVYCGILTCLVLKQVSRKDIRQQKWDKLAYFIP